MRTIKFLMLLGLFLGLVSCNYPLTLHVDCGDVTGLIEAIDIANGSASTMDTIELAKNCVYELEQMHNNTHGNNGLPPITSPILINGNGATISRFEKAVEEFRLFLVSSGGRLNLNDVTLKGGVAFDPDQIMANNSGGAIFNMGDLNIDHSTIIGNSAHGEGGGIANIETMAIKSTSVIDNECYIGGEWAIGGGAGIYNLDTATITLSAITGNGVVYGWDGIFNGNQAELIIENTTISHNGYTGIDNEGKLFANFVTFAYQPFAIVSASGQASIYNSLFVDSPCVGQAVHPVGDNMDTDGSCNVPFTVPLEDLDIHPLADNGGYTKTHALGPYSPAIDAASGDFPGMAGNTVKCPPTDQRGEPRPSGMACDIGAYEFQGVVPAAKSLAGTETPTIAPTSTSTTTPTSTLTSQSQACTVTALVNLYCRPAPGFEPIDSFIPGQSAEVVAQSEFLWQVNGLNSGKLCTVPKGDNFVRIEGDCEVVSDFTQLSLPTSTATKEPIKGCTVRQAGGAIVCEFPCPDGAAPGEACTR